MKVERKGLLIAMVAPRYRFLRPFQWMREALECEIYASYTLEQATIIANNERQAEELRSKVETRDDLDRFLQVKKREGGVLWDKIGKIPKLLMGR